MKNPLGYKIKNKSKFRVEVFINSEKVFIEPNSEKEIMGNAQIKTNFKELIIIEPIFKKEKEVKIIKNEEVKSVEEELKTKDIEEKSENKEKLNNKKTKRTRTSKSRKSKEK
jgi:hypothetical protein